MEKFAAEAIKAQRDHAIKSAVKAKVPLYDIMADFDLSEAEIAAVLKDEYGPPGKPKSDIIDARDEAKIKAAARR